MHIWYIFPEFENIGRKEHLHIFVQKARLGHRLEGKNTSPHLTPKIQPLGGFTGLISRLDCSRFGTFCVIALAVSILINVLLRRFTVALEAYKKKGRVWVFEWNTMFGNLRNHPNRFHEQRVVTAQLKRRLWQWRLVGQTQNSKRTEKGQPESSMTWNAKRKRQMFKNLSF